METDIERNHNHHFNPNHTISVNTFNEYVKDILEKHIKRKYKAHIRSEHTKHVTTLQESMNDISKNKKNIVYEPALHRLPKLKI